MAKKKDLSYWEKLKDPRWQKIRLLVFERDKWKCQRCASTTSTLHVHHGFYQFGIEPWEYPIESLHTYCETCHKAADELRKLNVELLAYFDMRQQEYFARIMSALLSHLAEENDSYICRILDFIEDRAREKREPGHKARLDIRPVCDGSTCGGYYFAGSEECDTGIEWQ